MMSFDKILRIAIELDSFCQEDNHDDLLSFHGNNQSNILNILDINATYAEVTF